MDNIQYKLHKRARTHAHTRAQVRREGGGMQGIIVSGVLQFLVTECKFCFHAVNSEKLPKLVLLTCPLTTYLKGSRTHIERVTRFSTAL